jgi:hypothetical protein
MDNINTLSKNQLANLFTNKELINLIMKDQNKLRKARNKANEQKQKKANEQKQKNANKGKPCWLYPYNSNCNNTGMQY